MHERRNFWLVVLLGAAIAWATLSWFIFNEDMLLLLVQRAGSLLLLISAAGWLIYALRFEDKLPDYLKEVVGDIYYEVDGLSFMPIVRVNNGRPELCLYYQNRFENPSHAVIHLRPLGESFQIGDGWSDVHFAFVARGGAFGVIHQTIRIPRRLKGDVVEYHLAAASYYPRSHGAKYRHIAGIPCGTLLVDWTGAAFKTGVHEVSGKIELINPVTIHLSMPMTDSSDEMVVDTWRQEQIHAGVLT